MDLEMPTNPVEGEDNATATPVNTQEVETEQLEPQYDADGNEIPDEEEVEIDPELKLKLSKAEAQKLKDAMLRQADYTRKTQALSERAKAFEAEAFQARQMDDQEISAKAQLNAMSQRYNQLQSINFASESARINAEIARAANAYDDDAQNHWRGELAGLDTLFKELSQLGARHQNLTNALTDHQRQRALAEQQRTAKLIENGRAELTKDIPQWNDTLKAKLVDHAVKAGIDADDLADIEANPAAARILHDAYQWRSQATQQKTAATIAAVQAVKPAARVGGGSSPPTGLDDRLSAEEWVRRRDAQVRKRA